MTQTRIDVRDLDYSWWEDEDAYQAGGTFHLPRHSVERPGEIDPEARNARLIDGHVEAKANSVSVGRNEVPVWTVGAGQIVAGMSRGGRERA